MSRMAQNEMKAMRDMPLRVRSTEGLGVAFCTAPGFVEPWLESDLISLLGGIAFGSYGPNLEDI